MAPEPKPTDSPSGELILALQNRINTLEANLQTAETDRKGKSFVEVAFLDSKVAELRAEIAELRAEKKAVIKEEKEGIKNGDSKQDEGLFDQLFPWV